MNRRVLICVSVITLCFYAAFAGRGGNFIYWNGQQFYEASGKAKQILLKENRQTLIVFKNDKSCKQCFSELNALFSNKGFEIILVTLTDSSVLSRKRMETENKKLMPSAKRYYTYCQSHSKAGIGCSNFIYDSLKINATPCVQQVYAKDSSVLFTFSDMYDSDGGIRDSFASHFGVK